MNPIERIQEEISKLIKQKRALEAEKEMLLNLPVTCPSCDGSGEESYVDAAGDTDIRDCRTCRGLGKISNIKCNCGFVITTDMIALRRETFPKCPKCGSSLGGQYRGW